MAAKTILLICACVMRFAIPSAARSDPCPDRCNCIAFETDCSWLGLSAFPSESEIWEETDFLRLNGNNLRNVPRLQLPGLREYELQENKIVNIQGGAFLELPELKQLNLSHNLIPDLLPVTLQPLSELETLDLSYNKLTKIADLNFNGVFLQKLEILDLSHNEIETLEKNSFTGLEKLDTLYLNHNKIKTIQYHPFNGMKSLWRLYLHSNHLQIIEEKNFYPMENLGTLTLNKNYLQDIRKMALYNLEGVEYLDISDNMLSEVPHEAVGELLSLKTLKVGGNRISTLTKKDFANTINYLTTLELSDMPNLSKIDSNTFDNLPRLKEVNISHNPLLTSLPATLFFRSFHALRRVDLSNNSLSSIDPDMLPWNLLFSLSVTGNRWRCDCSCHWMKNYTFETEIQCTSPKNLQGRMLDDIPVYELMCPHPGQTINTTMQTRIRLGISAAALVASLLVIILLLYRVRKRLPCYKNPIKYMSLYNIYDSNKDNSSLVVTFLGDKTETKSGDGVDLDKDML